MASTAANDDFDSLTLAWREFQARTPVKLRAIGNERHYRAMADLVNRLVDEIGDLAPPQGLARHRDFVRARL